MRYAILAAGAVLAGVAPALAAPIVLTGRADARGGYGSNPFLLPGVKKASPLLGINIAPSLQRISATGQTTLSGSYSREQYFNGTGHPDSLQILLQQSERLSPDLSMNAQASYSSSTNALNNTAGFYSATVTVDGVPTQQSIIDPLTIGLRTQRVQGSADLAWRASDADVFQLNGSYTHGIASRNISGYSFYNAGVGYTRTVGPRTHVGVRFGYSRTDSSMYSSTSTYEPGFVLVHRFSEIWTVNGNVGASIRRAPGQKSSGLGFDISLCGAYPVTNICFTGGRITSASGFGGARINTTFGVRASHQINGKDTVSFDVNYVNSDALGGLFPFAQQFTQVSGNFDHKIGVRWVVGVDGRFQSRDQDRVSGARALNGTVHLSYLFGHVG